MGNMKKKVVVGMSGGVDSSVAAALLLKQGYEVVGVFMQFWFPQGVSYGENRCCSLESFNSAKEVADNLGIKIYKLNVGAEFKSKIVDEFLSDYAAYKTPNPCISCNKFIKFDLFLKKALTIFEADFIATGHYARIKKTPKTCPPAGRHNKSVHSQADTKTQYNLYRPKDKNKDQTYFLYNLKPEQLKRVLFPLGNYDKDQVRKLAQKFNLSVYAKADSQEICFVGSSHYDFLKNYLKLKPGKIVDERGQELGQHPGLQLYTIGQRKGIGLSGGPWFVAEINKAKNWLVVTNNPEKSKMFSTLLVCHKLSWITDEPKFPFKCEAQIRYRSRPEKCKLIKSNNKISVEFLKSQRAIAPGQSVVFYKNNQVLGGGVIR